jgi:hypothetical protein
MFAASCNAVKVDQFTNFIQLVATTDWSICPPTPNYFRHHMRKCWSQAIVCGISNNRYMRTAAATHPCPRSFLCIFHDQKTAGITLGVDDLLSRTAYLSTRLEQFPIEI